MKPEDVGLPQQGTGILAVGLSLLVPDCGGILPPAEEALLAEDFQRVAGELVGVGDLRHGVGWLEVRHDVGRDLVALLAVVFFDRQIRFTLPADHVVNVEGNVIAFRSRMTAGRKELVDLP